MPNDLGIGSSVAAADPTHFALGYGDGTPGVIAGLQPGQELIQYTRVGDASLDGKVDFTDLTILARHYGKTNATWDQGDFKYEGAVVVLLVAILSETVNSVSRRDYCRSQNRWPDARSSTIGAISQSPFRDSGPSELLNR